MCCPVYHHNDFVPNPTKCIQVYECIYTYIMGFRTELKVIKEIWYCF